jgi:hypothetical protein
LVAPAPHTITIDGRKVLVVDRKPPLAPTLQLMLEGGRDATGRVWSPIRMTERNPLKLGGARSDCLMQDHRLVRWLAGFAIDAKGVVRFLALYACADCGAVCVRDQSVDTLERLPAGRRPPRRKDHIIGWYSGARPQQRIYT